MPSYFDEHPLMGLRGSKQKFNSDLKGKVAVVTGASKGIGAAIAKGLSAAGAAVVVNYSSSKESADRVVGAGYRSARPVCHSVDSACNARPVRTVGS
jgi:NAD(P)-dependent dehydrogenase (short-subunit alcohol dehydrogenase family)